MKTLPLFSLLSLNEPRSRSHVRVSLVRELKSEFPIHGPLRPLRERKPCFHQMLRRGDKCFVCPPAPREVIALWHCRSSSPSLSRRCCLVSNCLHQFQAFHAPADIIHLAVIFTRLKWLFSHKRSGIAVPLSCFFLFLLLEEFEMQPGASCWPHAQRCRCIAALRRHHPAISHPNYRAYKSLFSLSDSQKSSLGSKIQASSRMKGSVRASPVAPACFQCL